MRSHPRKPSPPDILPLPRWLILTLAWVQIILYFTAFALGLITGHLQAH